MSLTVVDVNGLSGALSYGMVQEGHRLLARTGYLGLGRHIVRANAGMWGGDSWEDAIDESATHDWESWWLDEKADVVVAVPPCSGFSVLTGKGTGAGSGASVTAAANHPSNDCMWSSARYAARHAPLAYVFESVTGAYTRGRSVMQGLHSELERISGYRYTLTHWLHDTVTLGAPTSRQRYMFVAVRGDVPFKVTPIEEYAVSKITTMRDALHDLAMTPVRVGEQKIARHAEPGSYAEAMRRPDGLVDGHYSHAQWKVENGKPLGKWHRELNDTMQTLKDHGSSWPQGASLPAMMERMTQLTGGGPEIMMQIFDEKHGRRLYENGFNMGAYFPQREVWDALCSVIAGDGPEGHIHPIAPRVLTYRECARVQGWPDELRIDYDQKLFGKEKIAAVWGKAVTVPVARHLASELTQFLAGQNQEGKVAGEKIGEREWVIDDLNASRMMRRVNRDIKKRAINAA